MNSQELVKSVKCVVNGFDGQEFDFSTKEIDAVLRAYSQVVSENIADVVPLIGVGKFQLVDRAARSGRNPQSGELLAIPACRTPKFHFNPAVSKELKIVVGE